MDLRESIRIVEQAYLTELKGFRQADEFKAARDVFAHQPTGNAIKDSMDRNGLMREFMSNLESKGYVQLGAGAYGCVLTHPGINYAVKIFEDDPAYLAYVKFALAHQDNPHVPGFRGKFMRIDDRHYAVRIELLTELSQDMRREVAGAIVAYGDKDIYPEDLEYHKELFEKFPKLPDAMAGIIDICRKTGCRLDVYTTSNIMGRNGVPVFTDPVAPKIAR